MRRLGLQSGTSKCVELAVVAQASIERPHKGTFGLLHEAAEVRCEGGLLRPAIKKCNYVGKAKANAEDHKADDKPN